MNSEFIFSQFPELISPIAVPVKDDHLKASAVLIVLHEIEEQWQLLFTKRSKHLTSHAGQISFPGGRYEENDGHLMQTALRETEEEIGINKSFIRVISQLDELTTLTGFRIFPFISIIENLPELTIDHSEVDNVFSVPLEFLFNRKNHQQESLFFQGKNRNFYKIVWQDRVIWGATAQIIINLSNYFDWSKMRVE